MISLTVNNAMLELLRQATGLAEVRDESGTVVGFFAPVNIERAHLYAQAAAQTDPQEMARRREAGRTYARLAKNLDRREIARRVAEEKPGTGWQEFLKKPEKPASGELARETPPNSPVTEGGERVSP